MSSSIESTWRRIIGVLREQTPAAVDALGLPATEQQIAATESAIGRAFPRQLRDLYHLNNGQPGRYMVATIFENDWLLPVERISEFWEMRVDILGDLGDDGVGWWHPSFIPFTDSDGDCYCVHAETGAVLRHIHDDGMRETATSLQAWLNELADRLESGRFTVELDSVWFPR